MKCDEIEEWLGIYWDLPEEDEQRQVVDRHIEQCRSCAEEFEIWQESTDLIRTSVDGGEPAAIPMSVSSSVMKRIYQEDSWRVPVGGRLYHFSYKLRRNLTAVVSLCLAMFMFTFMFSILNERGGEQPTSHDSAVFGRIGDPVVLASSQTDSMNVHAMPTAVASLKGFSEPFMYHVGPIHTVKDYILFISLLGLTSTLLIMNWLSRTRS
ncbi:anti-sigma factor family protein [Paenibacillus cremeus]|uniref:Zf-HC2 domain-containing protein n=1 Tax=Paenibacillus cremeus TaxID=2163881 RepID=A0A559KHN1_9BACL|nr:zf-HC2 domain-containing protein [Paenibacillus cremeus]TVY11629.1 zf-HC2 domain-containing protein [Paenibacillus cremeus]